MPNTTQYSSTLLQLCTGLFLAAASSIASASLTVTSVIGGAPAGVKYVNLDNLDLGAAGGTSNGVIVEFGGAAGPDGSKIVQGSEVNKYAAPYISNSNGVLFGDSTVSGPNTTKYVTTHWQGTVTFTLPEASRYFGLLWGSVDSTIFTNTLTFLDADGNSVGSINGTDVGASANGDQGALGTYYVNINSTDTFTKVVMSGNFFEADNIAYNATVPVPEASTYAMFLAGLGVLGVVARKKSRKTTSL